MPPAFVHEADAVLTPEADERALGAAVTVALCGHWQHEGACRWPHLTTIPSRSGTALVARVVFACGAGEESAVRARISRALRTGRLEGPTGLSEWRVVAERSSEPTAEDHDWADRHRSA